MDRLLDNLLKIHADQLLVAALELVGYLGAVLDQAVEGLHARRQRHDARAHTGLVQSTEPIVALSVHAIRLEKPVQAPIHRRIRVQPDDLVVFGQEPDLQLPEGDIPSSEAPCVLPGNFNLLYADHLAIETVEASYKVCAVRQRGRVGEEDQRVRADALQRPGHGDSAPEAVTRRCAGLVVRHHDIGEPILRRRDRWRNRRLGRRNQRHGRLTRRISWGRGKHGLGWTSRRSGLIQRQQLCGHSPRPNWPAPR
mmetsp:Transcript_109526/g.315433  ORF Transcript_109526/g.315433 Transcript_109526/m.315433 type:complete len:253 (+) Transcript_109526:1332-2090(+)